MALGLIKDTTLTAIADSLRDKGIAPMYAKQAYEYFKYASSNATGLDDPTPTREHTGNTVYISVPEATGLDLEIDVGVYKNPDTGFAYTSTAMATLSIANETTGKEIESLSIYRTTTHLSVRVNANAVSLSLKDAIVSTQKDWAAFTVTAYPVINGERTAIYRETDEIAKVTPEEMAEAINNFELGATIPEEAFHITGDCTGMFGHDNWSWFLDKYSTAITTSEISVAEGMFKYCRKIKHIPFQLNVTSDIVAFNSMFLMCDALEECPKIRGLTQLVHTSNFGSMIDYCHMLRDIEDLVLPEVISTFSNLIVKSAYTSPDLFAFRSMYSLRHIPSWWYNFRLNPESTVHPAASKCLFSSFLSSCYTLDEATNLPVWKCQGALTSNSFSGAFTSCERIKRITFEPAEADWKTQTITLTSTGYSAKNTNITNYNSGITADKEVKDDATYQALKNDPDWFTTKVEYSRYNHDSAVETINSLPDTSAYLASAGGTNTIKFKGNAGSATDGGAINTLTAEEIAVATAKGWTVTLS